MPTSKSKAYSYFTGCPEGYHKRSSYKTKTGKKVPTRCVRVSAAKNQTRRTASNKKVLPSIKSLSRKACPPGMIERKEYARKYSTAVLQKGFTRKSKFGKTSFIKPSKQSLSYVGSKCVKNIGLPGKGNKTIGSLKKRELTKYGYSMREDEQKRHSALKKAVDEYGALGVYRKLDAVSKLTFRSIPQASKVYEKDRNWIKEKYAPLKAF